MIDIQHYALILEHVHLLNKQCSHGYRPLLYDAQNTLWAVLGADYFAGYIWLRCHTIGSQKKRSVEICSTTDILWSLLLQNIHMIPHSDCGVDKQEESIVYLLLRYVKTLGITILQSYLQRSSFYPGRNKKPKDAQPLPVR